ncbi:MAG: VWA domain-containing protein [Gemmatimonadota bacterium]
MPYVTYEKYRASLLDALNLQDLLDRLSDFLLRSGFGEVRRGPRSGFLPPDDESWPTGPEPADALRRAILQAMMDGGQLTPGMLAALRGDEGADADALARLADLLDDVVAALEREGYLRSTASGGEPAGPGDAAASQASAHRTVRFDLTEKAIDFLSYRALRELLGAGGRASAGLHETREVSTGVEAEASSKPYRFGDTLNLDVPATLLRSFARSGMGLPLELDYRDLMVHQSAYRSSCATVLMLDCSHSMILYGEDRFTPAKRVALALSHLIRTQFPGDTLRCVLFHDSAEEIPISALARARVGPYHTNTAAGLALARRLLRSEKREMRQIVMITDGKPSALTLPDGRIYRNSMGLDRRVLQAAYTEVAACRREGVSINTFMLARDPALVSFVRRMTSICRGKAYFTTTLTLGQYLLLDYMRRTSRMIR